MAQRSRSSPRIYRAGVEARAEALFEPVIVNMPPGKDFWRIVFPESFALMSETFAFKVLLSRIIGAIRRRENFLASSSVGCTKRIEPGSWSIM